MIEGWPEKSKRARHGDAQARPWAEAPPRDDGHGQDRRNHRREVQKLAGLVQIGADPGKGNQQKNLQGIGETLHWACICGQSKAVAMSQVVCVGVGDGSVVHRERTELRRHVVGVQRENHHDQRRAHEGRDGSNHGHVHPI